jgi:beta-1,4-N-acetylglucosaminyltransferase
MGTGRDKGRVFVTVGTTLFDALVKEVDSQECKQVLASHGYSSLLIQLGRGSFLPTKSDGEDGSLKVDYFTFAPNLADYISSSALVISHAGVCIIAFHLNQKKTSLVGI